MACKDLLHLFPYYLCPLSSSTTILLHASFALKTVGFFLCLKHVTHVPTWPAVPLAGIVFSRYSHGLFPHLFRSCSNAAFSVRPSQTILLRSETLPHYLNPALSIPLSCFIFSICLSQLYYEEVKSRSMILNY